MRIRRILVSFVAVLIAFSSFAQQKLPKEIYLFDKFTSGEAYLKSGSIITTQFNYDPINRKMNYYEGDTKMELEGLATIDSVVVANRKFIPYQRCFLEIVPANNNTLFVDWKVKIKVKGKEGVLGARTQEAVTSLDVSRMQGMGVGSADARLYDITYENTYYLMQNNKLKKFTSLSSFLKLYPASQSQTIKDFVKTEKVDMNKVEDVVRVLNQFP